MIDLLALAARAMEERGFAPWPPQAVLAEAEAAAKRPIPDDVPDLTELPWTSIDNPESRDLDQIEALDGDRLYVGIADVDAFAARGSAIDDYAAHNATTVYTGIKVFPMLPVALSEGKSSLLPDGPRLAVVIETEIHPDGTTTGGRVYPARVRNRAKLDYPTVSAWLDGKADAPVADPALRDQVERQDRLAQLLSAARKRAGALDVDTAELRAIIDEDGQIRFQTHRQERAGRLVEELMIASNRTAARALDAAGVPSLRRIVREPEHWDRLVAFAGEHGFHLPERPSSPELCKFTEKMRRDKPPAEFAEISVAVVKLMGRGEYVAHRPGEPEIGHFGLATAQYTHATAPNRRYVDVIVQRLLKGGRYALDELERLAAHCTLQESNAQKVERQVRKAAAAQMLSGRIGELFDGVVTGASAKGTWVRVTQPPVEGRIIHGESGLLVGQRVRVRLRAVDVARGWIDFAV